MAAAALLGGENGGKPAEFPQPVAPPPDPQESGTLSEVTGRVTDSAGDPVAGALVVDDQSGRRATSDGAGRFTLRVRSGRRNLTATRREYLPHTRSVAVRRRSGSEAHFTLWEREPAESAPNSADRLTLWIDASELTAMSDADLGELRSYGVDGVVAVLGRLRGLGGDYDLAALGDRNVVDRAGQFGMRAYLGFYASNSDNRQTPFAEWFDDRAWRDRVLPEVRDVAAAARSLGFAGLALDQELYNANGATWGWEYPGRSAPEDEVRRQVKRRGAELMRALLRGYPQVELIAYYTLLPSSWGERVQEEVNDRDDAYANDVFADFWDGLTSVEGWRAIRWWDATFYKTWHLEDSSWDDALQQNARSVYALLSREFSGWAYAAPRLHLAPFAWIDDGPGEGFDDARSPAYVADQLAAFRKWGAGRELGVFAYVDPRRFDYRPYAPAMRAASRPGEVDSEPPRLVLRTPGAGPSIRVAGPTVDLAGTASDNLAVRAIAWRGEGGNEGVARLEPDGETGAGVTWRIDGLPLPALRTNTVWLRVEDVKGLATLQRITVER